MAVYTLAQWAQLQKEPLSQGLYMGMVMQSVIADIMPFDDMDGELSRTGVRFDEVITPDWIDLNDSIASKTANGHPLAFGVHQMAVHLEIPKNLDMANKNSLKNALQNQIDLTLLGAKYKLNNDFINGDQSVDPKGFQGLERLVQDLPTSQVVGSAELDLTASYTAALANTLWKRIDDAIMAGQGGDIDAFFTSRQTISQLRAWARASGLRGDHFDWLSATFDTGDPRRSWQTASTRPHFIYEGKPFYDLGFQANTTTNIIGNAYADGVGSATSRIYGVKFGSKEVTGLQFDPLKVVKVGASEDGTIEDKDNVRRRVKWTIGLACWGAHSIVKVQGLKVV